jgi:hemoglobin
MFCWATGGPQQYSGRSMHESHAHLKITGEEWVAFMEDLDATFDKFQAPPPEREEFIAIIASTKPDIVVPAIN